MKHKAPLTLMPLHAAFLLGACVKSSADTAHVNMLSRHMPDIAYTPANFAAWDGWTKAYAVTTMLAAAGILVWYCAKRQPMGILRGFAGIVGAYLVGSIVTAFWSFASDAVPVLAIPVELVLMIARWTWLPHTLGWFVLWYYILRDRKKREMWGHASDL